MPMTKDSVIPQSEGALRMVSGEGTPAAPTSAVAPSIEIAPKSTGESDGTEHGKENRIAAGLDEEATPSSLLEEATRLQSVLRDALVQSDALIRAVRRQRKQNRLVQSTLASLRELQRVGA